MSNTKPFTFDAWKATLILVSFVYALSILIDLVEYYHSQRATVPTELIGAIDAASLQP